MHRFYISFAMSKPGYAVTSFGSFIYTSLYKDLTNSDIELIESTTRAKLVDKYTAATVLAINYIGQISLDKHYKKEDTE